MRFSPDTDVDGPGPLTVTPSTFATNHGDSVTIEFDGDFTYLSCRALDTTAARNRVKVLQALSRPALQLVSEEKADKLKC
jgi:hypothetical protein